MNNVPESNLFFADFKDFMILGCVQSAFKGASFAFLGGCWVQWRKSATQDMTTSLANAKEISMAVAFMAL